MTRPLSGARRASFIVRVVRDRRGKVNGLIERVATGAKEISEGMEAIGPVIAGMLAREATHRLTGTDAQEPGKARSPAEQAL